VYELAGLTLKSFRFSHALHICDQHDS